MKRFIALTISLVILTLNISSVAFAEDDAATKLAKFCSNVSADTKGFYVVLEEPLGGPDAKYCFRVCTRDTGVVQKRICKIKSTCVGEPKGDLTKDVTCQRIQILKAESGINLLNQYVRLIYLWSAGTIGIVAVLTIVISGIQIMFEGSSGNIDTAKTRITQALFGLVVLFLSGLILYTVNPTFFV